MSHLVTVVQHADAMDGQRRVNGHHAELFVYVANGMSPSVVAYIASYNSIFSYSLLPALSLDGILCLDIIEGSFNTSRFAQFIDGLLYVMNPYPGPNSVIVMDNCNIHKDQTIIEMIEERYSYSYIL